MEELTYTLVGDYFLPNLILDGQDEREKHSLGKYGMLRERFLKNHHHGTYMSMLLTGRLEPHLREIDLQARDQIDRMVDELKKQNNVGEAMKGRNQMGWVQAANSFIAQAEEIVLAEIVYR